MTATAVWIIVPVMLFLVLSLYVAWMGRRMGVIDLHNSKAASRGAPSRPGMLVNVFSPAGEPHSGRPRT
ncbi:hypothetical protein [Actinomadura sp. 3N407]|uniref:hypothetical protein n=1 Tax=Actinomadura sp. 3N407 TaxID=3457423 RepID=UPI003FCC5DC3